MATTVTLPSARTGALGGLSRNHVLRYVAALGGLVALLGFYQPWVQADLNSIGATRLSGIELARGEASGRVDKAVFGKAGPGAGVGSGVSGSGAVAVGTIAAGPSAASNASLGGLVLPTRQPTAVSGTGSQGASQLLGAQAAPLSSPTAGFATATPIMNAALSGGAPIVAAAPSPEPPRPETLPQFTLFLVPVMGVGLVAFAVVWHYLIDQRDRKYGKAWTLIFSLGGTMWIGYLLYRITTAPAGNSLIGPGVGGVSGAEPAMWVTFFGFLLASVCLILAWLSPTPPAPDPYWRARASSA